MSRLDEWKIRKTVLDTLLEILSDGRSWKSRDLVTELLGRGIQVDKKLVNSILFSEGRRYVFYDKASYTYTLSHAEGEDLGQRVVFHNMDHPTRENPQADTTEKPLAARIARKQPQIQHQTRSTAGPAFFEVSSKGGSINIVYNTEHVLYQRLQNDETFLSNGQGLDAEALMGFLLTAWALMEEDQPVGKRRTKVEEIRQDWGRSVRNLLIDDTVE